MGCLNLKNIANILSRGMEFVVTIFTHGWTSLRSYQEVLIELTDMI